MPFGRVSPIVSKIVDGVEVMIRLHQQIAIDLRHDGSCCDGNASTISFDERNLRHLQVFKQHGVEEEDIGADGKIFDRVGHRRFAGAEDVDAVDRLRLHDADGNGAGAAQDHAADVEPLIAIELLGVVDAEEGRVGVEDDAGGDDRAGQAAAADLVGAGDGPKTKFAEAALDD